MIAQRDGSLARWPDEVEATWPEGGLVRQHVRVPLSPPGTDLASARVNVGLYNAQDGQRLALTVDGVTAGG